MIKRTGKMIVLATVAGAALIAANPAFAGRKTGSWKYSPDQIYQYQRSQEEAAWQQQRYYRHGPRYGGYGEQGYGYRPRYAPQPRYYEDEW